MKQQSGSLLKEKISRSSDQCHLCGSSNQTFYSSVKTTMCRPCLEDVKYTNQNMELKSKFHILFFFFLSYSHFVEGRAGSISSTYLCDILLSHAAVLHTQHV